MLKAEGYACGKSAAVATIGPEGVKLYRVVNHVPNRDGPILPEVLIPILGKRCIPLKGNISEEMAKAVEGALTVLFIEHRHTIQSA